MSKQSSHISLFEEMILVHMNAAYNLARWLTGNDQDAEDMVQEASLRAYQYFEKFQGENSRAWLLTIVRNTCYTWLRQNRVNNSNLELDEEIVDTQLGGNNPEGRLQDHFNAQLLRSALEMLPTESRELIILREVEDLSYKEIAGVAGIPLGTVMSRLARARQQLKRCLFLLTDKEGANGL